MRCSAYSGHAIIAAPAQIPSSTEFHPQCVTNPPVAACRSTSTCGAHVFTTRPRSLVRSTNPSGRTRPRSGSAGLVKSRCGSSLARTTHRNRCPLRSSPVAISLSCSAVNTPRLPKQRNTTLPRGCASSHRRHSCPVLLPPRVSGPTQ
ncbi:hypothetical protein ACMD2_05372 [Ananas comosus]|uniref:Uncharacterized protein n=1 Tax=Ananas comosus TaxID=4615 RepID=A0A199VV14_ANACO|nr:hypothetical protein ACMD2_05372 [Ananas comosus]